MSHAVGAPTIDSREGQESVADAVFILAGSAHRSSDLAPLSRPPALLPLCPDGLSNVSLLLQAIEPHVCPVRSEPYQRVLTPEAVRESGLPHEIESRLWTDRTAFRGTGGILADAAADLPDEARILVLNGAEVFDDRLDEILRRVTAIDNDVVLCRTHHGSPIGVCVIRAECLRGVSKVGYQDFKEQVLPQLATRFSVGVVTLDRAVTTSVVGRIFDRASYLACRHRLAENGTMRNGAPETGVSIAEDAIVSDSAILRGARIQHGAVVARSIIDEGVIVRARRRVIDQVVVAG